MASGPVLAGQAPSLDAVESATTNLLGREGALHVVHGLLNFVRRIMLAKGWWDGLRQTLKVAYCLSLYHV
jgi:hypothetical protein